MPVQRIVDEAFRVAAELEGAARGCRSVRASLVVGRAAGLLRTFHTSARPKEIYLLLGQEVGDRDRVGASWVEGAWLDAQEAIKECSRLKGLAQAAGAAIGNPTLTGLSERDRESIREALGWGDGNLVVGRNGIAWKVEPMVLR